MSKGKGPKRKHNKTAKTANNATASASTQSAPATIRRGVSAPREQVAAPSPAPHTQAPTSAPAPVPAPKPCSPDSATPEQARARFALERIQALRVEWQEQVKEQKEFNSYASAMPFMIRANGLGQTAAFYRRKGIAPAYYRLYVLLGDWLAQEEQPFKDQPDLLEAITHSDQDAYLAAQIEALLFLDWVKKLASAFLAREDDSPSAKTTEAAP